MAERRPSRSEWDLGDYGGGAAGSEDVPVPLSWRQDPTTSLSDWTLIIASASDGGALLAEYHVHRAILGTGPRVCEYFSRLFRSAMCEASVCTSQLDLEPSAAAAVPLLLDFLYSGVLAATTQTAAALMHLASYLGCRSLHAAVVTFMQRDLTWRTAPVYLREGSLYSLEKVCGVARGLCATHRHQLGEGLLELPPAEFVRAACGSEGKPFSSQRLSELVASYFDGSHGAACDSATLSALSEARLMPTVSPPAALRLLELATRLRPERHATPGSADLPLADRCLAACASDWEAALLPRMRREASLAAAGASGGVRRGRLGGEVPVETQAGLLADALEACAAELAECRSERDGLRAERDGLSAALEASLGKLEAGDEATPRGACLSREQNLSGNTTPSPESILLVSLQERSRKVLLAATETGQTAA